MFAHDTNERGELLFCLERKSFIQAMGGSGWVLELKKKIWVNIHYDKLCSTVTEEYTHSFKLKIKTPKKVCTGHYW